MTRDEIRQAVAEAVAEGVEAALTNPELHCRYQISPEQHRIQHEAMEKFISFTGKIDSLKWGVFQKLIVFIVIGLFSLLVYGAAMKLRILGGLGWPGR